MKAFSILAVFLFTLSGCTSSEDEPTTIMEEENTLPILEGTFIAGVSDYDTSGKVMLNEDRTSLDLIGFETDDGPALELYLSTDLEATDFISLGELIGLKGEFTYDIADSENIDYNEYKYVMVWCVAFSANFGSALLEEQ